MSKKIYITILGCPKNWVDTEFLVASLDKQAYSLTKNPDDADIFLINTCGFTQEAIDENMECLKNLQDIKTIKPDVMIIAYGCLISRFASDSKRMKALQKKLYNIDKLIPVNSIEQILDVLNPKVLFKEVEGEIVSENILNSTAVSDIRHICGDSSYFAYLKIADGCDRKCAFCTIPSIKGKYTSIPKGKLLKEVNYFVEHGVQEINLIAQETTNYGRDLYGSTSFVELLDEISKIEKLKWIRIMYSHPNTFDERILDLMNERSNICHYIDIPLQHISDNVLNAMQRGTSSEKIKTLLCTMREKVPDICIRSTFIVGFPGETEADFNQLYNFIKEFELDRVGIFKYSREKGTTSYSMPYQISEKIKQERLNKIMSLQQSISKEKNKKFINTKLDILIEKKIGENEFKGRSIFDAPDIDNGVIINVATPKSKKHLKIEVEKIYSLVINDSSEYDLFCNL